MSEFIARFIAETIKVRSVILAVRTVYPSRAAHCHSNNIKMAQEPNQTRTAGTVFRGTESRTGTAGPISNSGTEAGTGLPFAIVLKDRKKLFHRGTVGAENRNR